jgi:hypothetical protein
MHVMASTLLKPAADNEQDQWATGEFQMALMNERSETSRDLESTVLRLEQLLLRVQAEYREMPGLCLTFAQAQRMWQLDGETCAFLLRELIARRFLRRNAKGAYVRTYH